MVLSCQGGESTSRSVSRSRAARRRADGPFPPRIAVSLLGPLSRIVSHRVSLHLDPRPYPLSTAQCITFFLVERVHLVHGQAQPSRRHNKIYLSNCLLLVGWGGVFVYIVASHKSGIRPADGQCSYFISRWSSLAACLWDMVIILYLSLLFAVPLYRGR
jgi:hypothetical protein